jgi:hypothetical protein
MRTTNKFKTKYDAFKTAVKVWLCISCQHRHERKKPAWCQSCGQKEFLKFDSRAELNRFGELTLMVRAGLIRNLETQVRFPIRVNSMLICTYVADFCYYENDELVVEDVKANTQDKYALTDVFKIKRKLLGAVHGIKIKIIKRRG